MESLEVEALQRDIHEPGNGAAAQGACPPLVVEVAGGVDQPHDGVAVIAQELPGVLVVAPGDGERLVQPVRGEVPGVDDALVRRFRHPPGGEAEEVYVLRDGVGPDHPLRALVQNGEEVGEHRPPGGPHPRLPGEARHVLLREPQGGEEAEVVEPLLLQILDARGHHSRLAGAQARKEPHPQPHNGQYRQVPPQALADLPQGGFQHSPYHSISSTGAGKSLVRTEITDPFFTWMTRSAIAVRALLWVMMMMVMP